MEQSQNLICLAVIPARQNSKRIPRKNIRLFGGKPLIAYTIEAALQSGIFEQVVVSTDSEEIADIAARYGAETPFLRSAELADDITPVSAVTLDALEKLDPGSQRYTCVAQLMANCPLRNANDIRDSYRQFVECGAQTQLSVTRFHWLNPWWAMQRDEQYRIKPLFSEQIKMRSQDLPALFCPTGAIWWAWADVLRRERTFYAPDRAGWEIPWQRAIDIDTEEDWQLAEQMLPDLPGNG